MRVHSPDGLCEYCGEPATEVDHLPPRSVRKRLKVAPLNKAIRYFEIDSCQECNHILCDRPLLSFEDRRNFVKSWLKAKYATYLNQPHWDEDDLEDLKDTLRDEILRGQSVAVSIRARLRWNRSFLHLEPIKSKPKPSNS